MTDEQRRMILQMTMELTAIRLHPSEEQKQKHLKSLARLKKSLILTFPGSTLESPAGAWFDVWHACTTYADWLAERMRSLDDYLNMLAAKEASRNG